MRRVLTVFILLLFISPLVSADRVSYYPDRQSFSLFLHSSATFHIVPGDEPWARGWAKYVDAKLSEVKSHGDDVLVLVGNVDNNPDMARVWNRTGLPPSLSFRPSVVVLNDTILITGSENNIYITWEAFSDIWRLSRASMIVFGAVIILIFTIFFLRLREPSSHAEWSFVASVSAIFVWLLLPSKVAPSDKFLRFFGSALAFSEGGNPNSPSAMVVGYIFRYLTPTDETIWLIHWVLIFLVTGLFFYIAPRRQRELGFISFGLVFATPLVRNAFGPMTLSTLGLTALVLVLAAIFNFTFLPESSGLLQTLALIGVTLLGIVFNPFVALLPLVFVLTFPKRPLRNLSYLMISLAFVAYLYIRFPGWVPENVHVSLNCLTEILKESILPLVTVTYAVLHVGSGIRRRGPTAFLFAVTLTFVVLSLAGLSSPAYSILLLSLLVPRTLHSIIPQT